MAAVTIGLPPGPGKRIGSAATGVNRTQEANGAAMDAMSEEGSPARERVGWQELGRWAAPWLAGALLMAAALLGLFTASRARDAGAYAMGFATAGLALLGLAWLVRRACDSETRLAALPVLVEDAAALIVLVALLAALAVLGLVLAARAREPMLETTGYALFSFGLVFIFWNLKHYFDAREHRPPG